MLFFAVRGVWRDLIGVLAIGALGWPTSPAAQAFQTLYSFQGSPDGQLPNTIVVDPATGNLYGTTRSGGNTAPCPANSIGNTKDGIPLAGCGAIFMLSQTAKGAPWTETLLHVFTAGADGAYPPAKLVLNNGALYGTTDVVPDTNGVLYGTVEVPFGNNNNLVYKLTPPNWIFTALHPSTGGDNEIRSGLVADKAGNLYGMSGQGTQATLFMLTAPTYAETTSLRSLTAQFDQY
jgi:hypothetical protein